MTRPGNPAPTTGPGTETPRGTTSPTGRGDCRRKSRFGADCQSGIALGIPGGFAAYTAGTVDGNSAPAPSSPWGVCTGPSQQKQNKIRDFSVAAFKSAGLPRRGVPRAAVRRGSRRNTSLAHLVLRFRDSALVASLPPNSQATPSPSESSPTVCADTPRFLSASTRILSGNPPRAMWSAAVLLALYRIRASLLLILA